MSWARYEQLRGAVYYRSRTKGEVLVGEQSEYVPGRAPFNENHGSAELRGESGKGFGSFRCVLLNSREETRQPGCVTHGGDVRDDVGHLSGSLRGCRDFVCLVDAEEGEKRHMKDVRWWRRDRGGDGQ